MRALPLLASLSLATAALPTAAFTGTVTVTGGARWNATSVRVST